MDPTAYDGRFFRSFVVELVRRRSPRYPQPSWFSALHTADLAASFEPPPPAVRGESRSSNDVGRVGLVAAERSEINVCRQFNRAADRWLEKYAPAFSAKAMNWKNSSFSLRKE